MNRSIRQSIQAYPVCRAFMLSLITLSLLPESVIAKRDNDHLGLAIAAGVVGIAGVAGLAGYGIYQSCNAHSLQEAKDAYKAHKERWNQLQSECERGARLSDQDIVNTYRSDVGAFTRHIKRVQENYKLLCTMADELDTIARTWQDDSSGKYVARDARELAGQVKPVMNRLSSLVYDLEQRVCLTKSLAELENEESLRSHFLVDRLRDRAGLQHYDIQSQYGSEQFVYLKAHEESCSRQNTYRELREQVERIVPPTHTTRHIASQTRAAQADYAEVVKVIMCMHGFTEDKKSHQQYQETCRQDELRRKEIAARERQIRVEQDRLEEDRRKRAQVERELDLKERELSQQQQDIILRGVEVVAHAGCHTRERDLQERLDERNSKIKRLEREIEDLRRELIILKDQLRDTGYYSRY